MRTRLLMIASAFVNGLLGGTASFLPQELLTYLGASPDAASILLVQLAGALYLGFAMLNWMARANLIGGIYSRPVAMGNFLHFTIGALALLRTGMNGDASLLLGIGGVYGLLAVWFGVVLFTHPSRTGADEAAPPAAQA